MSEREPEDIAKLREAFASLAERAGDAPSAPASSRAYEALHGELSPEERRALVAQLVTDPQAAEAWRLARELPPVPAAARAGSSSRRPWWTLAAALAAFALLGVLWTERAPQGPPVYRGQEAEIVRSTLGQAPVSRAEPVLTWSAVPGARYRVVVMTPELDRLEEADGLTEPRFRLSSALLARLAPGASFLWQVEVEAPGAVPQLSETFSARLE
jgi:hypothetical protein